MEQEELIERDVTLTVQLPEGEERAVTVHGSKPVMDLLVTLCAQHHLNPSDHIIKLISTNQNQIKFKPNSLIGCLEAERVVLKPKGSDDISIRVSNMPVATVRLMISYRTSHKAVVRVNPRVPLVEIMPAVCEKCEFDPNTTVLLRDGHSEDPLDLTKTLNDYGIRDLYARDTKGCLEEKVMMREKHQREKENKGFLSLFRRSKKTAESNSNSVPTSPSLNTQHVINIGCLKANSPTFTPFADMPKKRRAPQPPSMVGSQSFPCGLNSSQSIVLPTDPANGNQGVLSRVSSTESSLKRTKRRAPPPPCSNPSIQDSSDKERSCVGASLFLPSLEEAHEKDDVLPHSSDNCANECSDLTPDWPTQSPSLMAEILSEFMGITKANEEGLSTDSSVTHLPPAANGCANPQSLQASPASGLDSGPIVPPGCQLQRNCSQRQGLTTFTVVPQRRQPSPRQYEVLITLEGSDSLEERDGETGILGSIVKQGENLEQRNTESEDSEEKEIENLELRDNEIMTVAKSDGKGENLEATNGQLDITESVEKEFDKLKLNTNIEKHVANEREKDLLAVEEEKEEKDWVEEYRKRRRRFQVDEGDRKAVKFDKWMNVEGRQEEQDCFRPTPLDWEEEEYDIQEKQRKVRFRTPNDEEDKDSDDPTGHPKPLHTAHVPNAYWDANNSSYLHSSNLDSGAQVPLTYQSSQSHSQPLSDSLVKNDSLPTPPPLSFHSGRDSTSAPKLHPTGDLPSPAPMSLFALAVSQKAQSLRRGFCPLTPSTRSSCSQIQLSRVFCSQSTTWSDHNVQSI